MEYVKCVTVFNLIKTLLAISTYDKDAFYTPCDMYVVVPMNFLNSSDHNQDTCQ